MSALTTCGPGLPGRQLQIAARIKIISLAWMSAAGAPRDGRTRCALGGAKRDIRVSHRPTIHGEKVAAPASLLFAGTAPAERAGSDLPDQWRSCEAPVAPRAILVTARPAPGSRTRCTRLFADTVDDQRNVITVEDPVEVDRGHHPGPGERVGVTFDTDHELR